MKMRKIWHELVRRNRLLAYGGLIFLILAGVSASLIPFDHRTVTGINPWMKPLKFDLSILMYLWTLAWLLYYIREQYPRSVKWISRGVLLCMLAEIVCIKVQAVRGVPSHFNNTTPVDGLIFGLMGQFIVVNTLLVLYATVLFGKNTYALPLAYLWGIRLGLLTFLLGSLVGVVMVMQNGHSVGVADGGPGLLLMNWSTTGGDLRAAHFVGMHALQLFPLVGYLLQRYQVRAGKLSPVSLTILFCVGYFLLVTFIFNLAMQGKPLLSNTMQ